MTQHFPGVALSLLCWNLLFQLTCKCQWAWRPTLALSPIFLFSDFLDLSHILTTSLCIFTPWPLSCILNSATQLLPDISSYISNKQYPFNMPKENFWFLALSPTKITLIPKKTCHLPLTLPNWKCSSHLCFFSFPHYLTTSTFNSC